jgi:uncharacterized membrane protein HdeD (DUF308 family)
MEGKEIASVICLVLGLISYIHSFEVMEEGKDWLYILASIINLVVSILILLWR